MNREKHSGGRCERSYFRVRCRLPIRTRLVPPEQVDGLEYEILHRKSGQDLSQLDTDVAAWLDRIEQKIDRVLIHLGANDDDIRPTAQENVVLSGGGIRLRSEESCEAGRVMLLEFELPGAPAHLVRCLADVVAVYDDADGGRDVALTYRAIHAHDREAIVQHTLAVERGEQRSRADDRKVS